MIYMKYLFAPTSPTCKFPRKKSLSMKYVLGSCKILISLTFNPLAFSD